MQTSYELFCYKCYSFSWLQKPCTSTWQISLQTSHYFHSSIFQTKAVFKMLLIRFTIHWRPHFQRASISWLQYNVLIYEESWINIMKEKKKSQIIRQQFISTKRVFSHKNHHDQIPPTLLHNYDAPKLKAGIFPLPWENQSANLVSGQTVAYCLNLLIVVY